MEKRSGKGLKIRFYKIVFGRRRSNPKNQRGKLNDFEYYIFFPYKDFSVVNRRKIEECLKSAGLLEDDVAESYVNSEGKVFTKEEIRKGIESKKPLLLICDGVPIKGIIDMMKFMRVEGSGRFFSVEL